MFQLERSWPTREAGIVPKHLHFCMSLSGPFCFSNGSVQIFGLNSPLPFQLDAESLPVGDGSVGSWLDGREICCCLAQIFLRWNTHRIDVSMVYLPTFKVDVHGFHAGTYTRHWSLWVWIKNPPNNGETWWFYPGWKVNNHLKETKGYKSHLQGVIEWSYEGHL